MPTDPETPSWIAGMLAAVGVGGGFPLLRMFATQSSHSTRLDQLEKERDEHSAQIQDTHTTVTRLDERTEHIQSDVSEIATYVRGLK